MSQRTWINIQNSLGYEPGGWGMCLEGKKQARYLLTLSQENPNMNMSMNMDMDMETDTYMVDMVVMDMDVYTNMEGTWTCTYISASTCKHVGPEKLLENRGLIYVMVDTVYFQCPFILKGKHYT
jgi:hypothetical protein